MADTLEDVKRKALLQELPLASSILTNDNLEKLFWETYLGSSGSFNTVRRNAYAQLASVAGDVDTAEYVYYTSVLGLTGPSMQDLRKKFWDGVLANTINPLAPPVVSDSFNRANGAIGNADTGQPWVAFVGTPVIFSNQYLANGVGLATSAIDSGLTDCTVAVTMLSGQFSGLIWRVVDGNNYLLCQWEPDNSLGVYTRIAGVFTLLADSAPNVMATGRRVSITISGNNFIVKVDGTTVLTTSSTSFPTITAQGIYSGDTASRLFDNFTVSA